MMRTRLPNAAKVAATLLAGTASGCISFTGPASALRPVPRDSLPRWQTCDSAPHCPAEVRLTYLGVAGFLIHAGTEAVMTAPSFTHPSIWAIATPLCVGRWIYSPGRRLRIMAMRSSHAPNWWFITLAPCHERSDRTSLPRTGWGWCLGEPLSYVVDLLDDAGRPAFRIFYQDAASRPLDVVLPPFARPDQRTVDLAI